MWFFYQQKIKIKTESASENNKNSIGDICDMMLLVLQQ